MLMHDLSGHDDPRQHLAAVINFASDTWHLYATGYQNAANELVHGIDEGTITSIDTLVYPIAYMYRHSVELWLKQLITSCGKFLGKTIDLRTSHKLKDLWGVLHQLIKDVLQDAGQKETKEDRQFIRRVVQAIENIEALDYTSMVFRYPCDKDMVPHLQGWKYLHLGKLSERFNELIESLRAMSDWLSALFDQKAEWLSAMNDLYGTDEEWY